MEIIFPPNRPPLKSSILPQQQEKPTVEQVVRSTLVTMASGTLWNGIEPLRS
jgi:hypothetical protein